MTDTGEIDEHDAWLQSLMEVDLGEYDKKGNPISVGQRLLIDTEEYSRVGSTYFSDRAWVSTKWLGIDYSFGRDRRPRSFETMVRMDDEWFDRCRYSSELLAMQGHCEKVIEVSNRLRFPEEWEKECARDDDERFSLAIAKTIMDWLQKQPTVPSYVLAVL